VLICRRRIPPAASAKLALNQQFIDDQRRRNAFEGKFGQGKRRFGLGLIREKLALTQGSTIEMNILVMNLEKLLELLLVIFTCWLHLLWADYICIWVVLS